MYLRVRLLGLTCGLAVASIAGSPSAHPRKLLPTDEAYKDPSFQAFRQRLVSAVQHRDTDFILRILARDAQLTFGGARGPVHFLEMWRPRQRTSRFWPEFARVLGLGGSFVHRPGFVGFEAPYVSSCWPEGPDPYTHVAVTVAVAQARHRPSFRARAIRTLSYDIVRVADDQSGVPDGWLQIWLSEGATAYVQADHARSPIAERAYFEKISGRWMLTGWIAGD